MAPQGNDESDMVWLSTGFHSQPHGGGGGMTREADIPQSDRVTAGDNHTRARASGCWLAMVLSLSTDGMSDSTRADMRETAKCLFVVECRAGIAPI